jgi:hypothetical protein
VKSVVDNKFGTYLSALGQSEMTTPSKYLDSSENDFGLLVFQMSDEIYGVEKEKREPS